MRLHKTQKGSEKQTRGDLRRTVTKIARATISEGKNVDEPNYISLQAQAVSLDDNTGTQPSLTNRADSRLW